MFFARRPASKKKGNYKSYAARKDPGPAVKSYVKKAIAKNVENKTKVFHAENEPIPGSANGANVNAAILPVAAAAGYLDIAQGTGNGSRVGNRIKVKKLVFKGTLMPFRYDASVNPIPQPVRVKVWFYYDKTEPNSIPIPGTTNDFFEDNNSVATFSNNVVDLWRPVNQDKYRLLKTWEWKLGNQRYDSNGTSFAGSQYYTNNDFKMNADFSFDLTKLVPGIVTYQDNNANPTSRGLYAMFLCYNADGSTIGSATYPVELSYLMELTYEDA